MNDIRRNILIPGALWGTALFGANTALNEINSIDAVGQRTAQLEKMVDTAAVDLVGDYGTLVVDGTSGLLGGLTLAGYAGHLRKRKRKIQAKKAAGEEVSAVSFPLTLTKNAVAVTVSTAALKTSGLPLEIIGDTVNATADLAYTVPTWASNKLLGTSFPDYPCYLT